jgi:hypothetical protein
VILQIKYWAVKIKIRVNNTVLGLGELGEREIEAIEIGEKRLVSLVWHSEETSERDVKRHGAHVFQSLRSYAKK